MNFRHIFLITFRSIKRSKNIFFINLLGLSAGLASAFMIYLWVQDEWQKDKFHNNDAELHQVMLNFENSRGKITTVEWTPSRLAPALVGEIPEVKLATTLAMDDSQELGIIATSKKAFKATENYTNADFFKVFSFKLLLGNQSQVLQSKKGVLISDQLARKLLGRTKDALGKTITWKKAGDKRDFVIEGVFEKPTSNSSLQFDVLFSLNLYSQLNPDTRKWEHNSPNTYVVLTKGTSTSQVNDKIKGFLKTKGVKTKAALFLNLFSSRYLFGKYVNGVQSGGRILYVRLFSILALFILVIACINFMNLSTARASRRMKEIGIKKVVGVHRKTLIAQFLGESIVITLLALLVAITLVELLLPQFNLLTNKNLGLHFDYQLMLVLAGITLVTGLIAGSYPALYLSSFSPIKILKGNQQSPKREVNIRRGLVVFQFTVSIMMIVSTVVIYRQIQYIQSKPLGYDQSQVVVFKRDGKLQNSLETFFKEAKKIPGVVQASSLNNQLQTNRTSTKSLTWEGGEPDHGVVFKYLYFNYDAIETLGIEVKQGRSFSRKYGAEDRKIIFNEAAIKAMGIKDPIGKIVTWGHKKYQIVGTVKNFHFESLYEELKPCFIRYSTSGDLITVKIQPQNASHTLAQLSKLYQTFNPGLQFEYSFLDKTHQDYYAAERRVATLSQYFAGFAILISCLGLFGLAAFTLERRLKEIGIRKILGSSNLNIVYLLSREYTQMVVAAIAIGLPLSYYLIKQWLYDFSYRIHLGFEYFVLASVLILLVAWFTVGLQTIRASRINPVDCLRDE
ncbi:MAG TPA: transporter permease [Microscillaceae bacterium]|nr:transporter permease [Microscillaceae bacterium]